jgi:hypothetical protein
MRSLSFVDRGSTTVGIVLLALLAALPAAGRIDAAPTPPKSFSLWPGRWSTPYGTLTLVPTTAAVPPDVKPRPAVRGTFSNGGSLLGRLDNNRGDAGDLSNTVVTGNYQLPNAGSGRFLLGIDTSELGTAAFRQFTFNAFGGSASTFTAPYLGGGATTANLLRSFRAAAPTMHREGNRVFWTVRWHYAVTLTGPAALPKPGLVLRFRYSRPIRPLHFALASPNVSQSPLVRHIAVCREVLNRARTAKLGFDCETFSLGPRHGAGNGWQANVSFSATVPAGSGRLSASISNTETDRFALLPRADRTVLRAGRAIPAAPRTPTTPPPTTTGPSGGGWTGTWDWVATIGSRVFRGTGMSIVRQGPQACAVWPWSAGSGAKGPLSADGSAWSASWYDAYGRGAWTLRLAGNGRFTGSQSIDPHGSDPNQAASIVGTRTSTRPSRSLDCSTLRVGP